MRFRPFPYPIFLLYELIRLFLLMEGGGGAYIAPLGWYAAVPLLTITPVLLFMLSSREEEHRHWLPLIALVKAVGIPAFVVYIAEALQTAFRFGAGDDGVLVKSMVFAVFFILGDAVIGVYCFGRNRILCK